MTASGAPVVVSVRPEPSPDVMAAIVAAVEQAWPRPRFAEDVARRSESSWRFSGRWWTKPASHRRDRPWVAG